MTKHSFLSGVVFICALVAASGCKKDKSDTAADAESSDPIVVLDAGDRPRSQVRFKIPEGTTTTSIMTFRIARVAITADSTAVSVVPGVRLHIVSGPAVVTENGVRYNIDVVKSEAVIPPDTDAAVAADLEQGAAILDQLGGWVEVGPRGVIIASEFNEKAQQIPARLLFAIINARLTLSRVVLPAEKVGVGARWEVRQEMVYYGFKLQQVNTYKLVDRVGAELMLDVDVQQIALPQTIELPDLGASLSVESSTSTAKGQIILNLESLTSDASATGDSTDLLVLKMEDGTENIEVDEEFEVQIVNTTDLPVE